MEPRAIIAEHDKANGRHIVTVGSQGVHGMRDAMCKVLKIDPKTMRVLTHDVGGGFGTKSFNYREYPLTVKAAETLGRPVKWVSDRSEHFLADAHGRDHVTDGAWRLTPTAASLALRVEFTANMGSYFNQFGALIPWLAIVMMTGVYDIQTAHARLPRRLHQHRPDRRLSRRRPPGGGLSDRAADGRGGACDRP